MLDRFHCNSIGRWRASGWFTCKKITGLYNVVCLPTWGGGGEGGGKGKGRGGEGEGWNTLCVCGSCLGDSNLCEFTVWGELNMFAHKHTLLVSHVSPMNTTLQR